MQEGMIGYPSIDKPWLKYYSEEAINGELPQGSLYDYLVERNKDYLDDYAINYFGNRKTYRNIFEMIDTCARALINLGAKPGDMISICTLAIPEAAYLLYAVNKIGAISNFIVLNGTDEETAKQLSSTKSEIVFTVDISAEKILKVAKQAGVKTVIVIPVSYSASLLVKALLGLKVGKKSYPEYVIPWTDFLRKGINETNEFPVIDSENTAIIEYTSGTTGVSKGVVLSNKAANTIAFHYINSERILEFTRKQSFLDIIPPFLSYGLFLAMHMPLCVGMEVILYPDPSPRTFPKVFAKYKPNHFSAGPLHINSMVADKHIDKMNLSFLHTAAYGGDGANKEWEESVVDYLHRHGCKYELLFGYGLTEMASSFGTKGHHTKAMLPFAKNNIKIIDIDSGEELTYNKEGEILISGPSMMNGYYMHEEETTDTIFLENGVRWMHTGDLGYVTEEGYFYISGRIKRILWAVGDDDIVFRVYPMKIEDAICTHPNVHECAAVGIPNGEKGYLVKVFVNLKKADQETERIKAEIFGLCKEKLPACSLPSEIEFVGQLPRTSAGKIDYKALEKLAVAKEE